MLRRRLDVEMVRRGMAASRSEATGAIRSGKVTVAGRPAAKSSMLVQPDEPIAMARPARRFVSRGGDKLDAALDRFGIDVSGRTALDAGASTGGFSDCLRARGATHVSAVGLAYGQLDWGLREDRRVTVLERTNVRDLRPDSLPNPPGVVTADLSFISLRLALPGLVRAAAPDAEFVLLVKRQFEAGREQVDGGVVRDPEVWRRVLRSVANAAGDLGLDVGDVIPSPLLGPAGNVEFFIHAHRGKPVDPGRSIDPAIDRAVEEATELASDRG